MSITIVTNNVPREIVAFYELPDTAREDFDYVTGEDQYSPRFVRYLGEWYDVNEFSVAPVTAPFNKWHGVQSDSFFSGVLIRYSEDFETVVVGRYFE